MSSNNGAAREYRFTAESVTERHPGKDPAKVDRSAAYVSWERTDRADGLRAAAGLLAVETGARAV